MALNPRHIGSSLDNFLEEEGILEHTRAVAVKRVLAFQIEQNMAKRKLSKAEMARRMKTSRSALDRLLDPDVPSVTLLTLEKAASALGMELHVKLA